MAPTPKQPGHLRRRNKQRYRDLPAGGRTGKAPALGTGFRKSTRAWWTTIWRSPMATAWEEADIDGLRRLARLKDDFDRGAAPATALPAMQQLEDRYGLNPKSRQAMLWQIKDTEGDDAGSRPLAPVRRLRAVDPAGAAAG